jgi:maleate isomerase
VISTPDAIGAHDRRVGLLVPSSNTVMEVDFYTRLSGIATVHTARMYMESTTPEGENLMLDEHTMPAAMAVATAKPDLIVFGCTSAGALRGNVFDRELCARITRETGVPTISVIAAVREAIGRRAGRRVAVLTPYTESLNEQIQASLEQDGIEVAGIWGLGIDENFQIARVTPAEILDFAEVRLPGLVFDLLFVSCTNLRAVDAIPPLERRFGVPVVTSNQAALEAVLVELGRGGVVDEPGGPPAAPRAGAKTAGVDNKVR